MSNSDDDTTAIPIPELSEIALFDVAVLHFGFEQYKRDFFYILETGAPQGAGTYKAVFTHVFELMYRHKFADPDYPDTLRASLSDDLISRDKPPESDKGYWWGQGFTFSYPGLSHHPQDERAREMSKITGVPMHAVSFETEHYVHNFIFHGFRYELLSPKTPVSDEATIPLDTFRFRG